MDCGIFIWNCQGANGSKFVRTMRCFVDEYKAKILVLLEPRISGSKADRVIRMLGFDRSHRVEAKSFSEGIWIL